MYVFASILIELLLITSCILILFNLRDKLGLAPLYILLGCFQYFQVNLEKLISFNFLGKFPIYPGSVILFSALLFALLLIYIKEGVQSARTLIIGILISNFFLAGLFEVTAAQDYFIRQLYTVELDPTTIFNINYKYFIIGTIILLFDFILLAVIYQFLISKIKKPFLFFILFLSLWSVLIFDALAFNIGVFYSSPTFTSSLIGHVIGKTVVAFLFAAILHIYLTYIDKEKVSSSFIVNQQRDILSILKYRKKYMDLKIEKKNVEDRLLIEKKQMDIALKESEAFNNGILSSLSAHIAVIDKSGEILAVNKAWNEFSINNGESNLARTSVGSNYIEICKKAISQGDTLSLEVLEGFRAVLQKEKPSFSIEYPCHSPLEKRWFTLHVVPFGSESDKLVISHINVTKLKIAEKQLENSNLQLKEAQRMAKIGSWEFNPFTKEVHFSDEMYNILEIDKDSKENLFDLYRSKCLPEDYNTFNDLVDRSIKNEKGYAIGYYIKANANKIKYIHEIGETVRSENGQYLKLKGTIQDFTEDKRIHEELSQKNEELLKANKELDRFVYSASHDLRAPLTSLMGLIEIMDMILPKENEDLKEPLSLMSKTIDKMDVFIRSIFDYSVNSRREISIEKIDFETLIRSIWESLKFMNIKYNPEPIIEISQETEFYSDKKRLEIILGNLVSNAIKYYDENKTEHFVKISVTVDHEKAAVVIEDNGIGIGEEHKDKIFEMFYRATKMSTGSGMGTYIVKETLDKLQGTIEMASELEKGTRFSITIPNSK
ncbi:PAS domain-containing sensor histidine kinase [Sediminicola sp. 1XM1-17]|uniref:PAS domain-containing sensor histidine kinase n=1 Tax=Sediminicola sp. 1XM1-17 TaxID=3127702 RepID=UPI003076C5EC